MSDGTTAAVAIKQSTVPDRSIDCDLMPDGSYRQRVDAVRVAELLEDISVLVRALVSRTPFMDVLTGRPQSPLTSAVTVSSGTVTTVSTLSAVTAIGGITASYDQYNACTAAALTLRSRISVT